MRALSFIALLALTVAFSVTHPHTHDVEGKSSRVSCTACELRDTPSELGSPPELPPMALVAVAAPPAPAGLIASPGLCLTLAPKQGPPAA
ncbi:MAG: hypothetical protein ACYC8T_12565 [Myxococcaceae bacterium]